MSEIVQNWPSLPVKRIVSLGKYEFVLKSKETSEALIPSPLKKDGHLTYQFYHNKAHKLIGYRFLLEDFEKDGEVFPRVNTFASTVMASYVPANQSKDTGHGDFHVCYHDLIVRLLRYTAPNAGLTYCVLLRAKLDHG